MEFILIGLLAVVIIGVAGKLFGFAFKVVLKLIKLCFLLAATVLSVVLIAAALPFSLLFLFGIISVCGILYVKLAVNVFALLFGWINH